jgi:hypothetical protein
MYRKKLQLGKGRELSEAAKQVEGRPIPEAGTAGIERKGKAGVLQSEGGSHRGRTGTAK